MDTPPGTTLSTPSPTELQDKDPIAAEAEKADMQQVSRSLKPIYLVVATTPCTVTSSTGAKTRKLGIGLNGKLPWPMIKVDMRYFKDVTESGMRASLERGVINSVIMGRKTYSSIPEKFRPLASRHNIVITRSSANDVANQILTDLDKQVMQARAWVAEKYKTSWEDLSQAQLDQALDAAKPHSLEWRKLKMSGIQLKHERTGDAVRLYSGNEGVLPTLVTSSPDKAVKSASELGDGNMFCIGGSEIYNAFLQDEELRPRLRILQTEIQKVDGAEYECDTFWSEALEDDEQWQEVKKDEVSDWTAISLPQGTQDWYEDEKVGVRLRVRGWKVKGA